MPDDLRDFVLPDPHPLTDQAEARFALNPAVVALPYGERPEPNFASAPVMIGFGDPEPGLEPESADPEPPLLDLSRAAEEPQLRTTDRDRRDWVIDLTAAFAVHLLSVLLFLYWTAGPAEMPPPIPVQLLLEPPPPSPEPPKPPEAKPPVETKPPAPGTLASVDIGGGGKPEKSATDNDTPDEASAAAPEHKPAAPPMLVSALPKVVVPPPQPLPDVKADPPDPARPVKPAVRPAAVRPAPIHHPGRHPAEIPGPDATRDEYLAYCMSLVRQHYGVLPASFLAGRQGLTVLKILVLSDGTIARIQILHPSGYSDVDQRVEQMIAAVRRFPPLPQWIQQPSIALNFELAFPQGLVEQ